MQFDGSDIIIDMPFRYTSFSFYEIKQGTMPENIEPYSLTTGSVILQEVGNGRLRGTFSGSGYLEKGFRSYDSTHPFTVTSGSFDVPYDPDIEYSVMTPERAILAAGTDPLLDRYRDALAVRRQRDHIRIGR